MTQAEALYRDSLLRWLCNRRDHPGDNTPEPEIPMTYHEDQVRLADELFGLIHRQRARELSGVRAEVIRDFERKQ